MRSAATRIAAVTGRALRPGVTALVVLWGLAGTAAESNWVMDPMQPNLEDKPSLQRGAALYTNYCLGCHSLKFQRYERTADDLEIPHSVALKNLVFTGQQIGSLMVNSMPDEKAKGWFGTPPPDLTMVARVRDPEWIYNLLTTFYADESRPFGVNNKVYPNIGMPHVLMGLQGVPTEQCRGNRPVDMLDGEELLVETEDGYEPARVPNCDLPPVADGSGAYSPEEFRQAAYDITNFLYYVGEPTRLERERLGYWVLAFLAGLFVIAWLLNREYWKDVH